mgnify:FL=1
MTFNFKYQQKKTVSESCARKPSLLLFAYFYAVGSEPTYVKDITSLILKMSRGK